MRQFQKGHGSTARGQAEFGTLHHRLEERQEAIAKLTAARQELAVALQAAARYARGLMEACPAPLMAIGADGGITDINEAGARLAGVPRERLIGTDFSAYFTQPEAARSAYRETCSRGFVTDHPLVLRHASGALTDVLYSALAYADENNQVAGVFATARDMTGEKQHQAEVTRLKAQLVVNAEELERRESEIQQMSQLYDVLQTCNSQKEAYPAIRSVAAELFPGSCGALATTMNGNRDLETVAVWGNTPLMLAGFSVNDCWAVRRGQAREVQQPGTPLECRHFRTAPQGPYVCLPLTVRGELQGLLTLCAAPGLRIHDRQRHLLVTLGEVVKLSLSNLRLREVLRAQAIKDPLTGLFNRHYLDETLRRELSRCKRRHTPLCVALLDIDDFKEFNDSHGHDAGDAVLKALGSFFQTRLRSSDIACRYGGDEFVLALLDTDVDHVLTRLEQLCAEIKRIEPAYEGGLLPALSVSMGVAQGPGEAGTIEELLKAADRALYVAKTSGRNRIQVYGRNADGLTKATSSAETPADAEPAPTQVPSVLDDVSEPLPAVSDCSASATITRNPPVQAGMEAHD